MALWLLGERGGEQTRQMITLHVATSRLASRFLIIVWAIKRAWYRTVGIHCVKNIIQGGANEHDITTCQ